MMHEGLDWEWEYFGDYLDALDRRQRDIDVGALLPHSAVRVFVMGDRATQENANQGDIAQMRQIATEAMQAARSVLDLPHLRTRRCAASPPLPYGRRRRSLPASRWA